MFRWQCCTRELVYSWARLDGDAEAEASPLLAPLSTAAVTKAAAEPPRTGLLQLAAEMEPCAADVARSWPAGALARGGAGLLQAQSQCPFKAAALWRLDCSLLESPVAGVTAQLHGRIVHSALQRLWQELQDAAGLHSQPVAAWQPRVAVAVRAAIQDLASGEAPQVPALAWQVEQQRCQQLLLEALELERGRPKFRTLQLEQESPLWLDDLQLRVRVDRVDLQADADGTERQVLIDYKTGKRQGTDWESMRPQQVQLQTYALLSDSLCVATSLHLHRGTARWSGIADSAGRVPGIRAAGDWQALRARWRLMLHTLARDFVAGQATVDPLKQACDHCGLQLLCRVNAEVYADSVAGALPDGAGDSDADGEHD
jgi:RecB family exonuclease